MEFVVFVVTFFCLFRYSHQVTSDKERGDIPADVCVVKSKISKFNYTTHYCCKGNPSIIKIKDNSTNPCCENILPNGTIITCCGNQNLSVALLKKASCCSFEFYNTEITFCLNGTIYEQISSAAKISTTLFPPRRYTTISKENGFNIALLILCSISIICSSVLALYICKKPSRYRSLRMDITDNTLEDQTSLETDGNDACDGRRYIGSNIYSSASRNVRARNGMAVNFSPDGVASDKNSQTDHPKKINVKNIMGKQFDKRHEFDKNNKTLELPYSAAKLTLSEEDVASGPVECWASSHRNLKDVYRVFQKYLKQNEEVVSPTMEYFFPSKDLLNGFARLDMKYFHCECSDSFSVFKFEYDSKTKRFVKVKIKKKEEMSIGDDEYYEIIAPGKVCINLKSFCTIVCTVCHGKHDSLVLAAQTCVVPIPCNDPAKQMLKISMYILARVGQIQDYQYEYLNEDEQQMLSQPKRIRLPRRIQLEDYLIISLDLLKDSEPFWRECALQSHVNDDERVQLINIVTCPRDSSDATRWPYTKEWVYEIVPVANFPDETLVFNGTLSIAYENPHPGVFIDIPEPTKILITRTVDISNKKIHWLSPDSRMQFQNRDAQQSRDFSQTGNIYSRNDIPSPNIGAQAISQSQHEPTVVMPTEQMPTNYGQNLGARPKVRNIDHETNTQQPEDRTIYQQSSGQITSSGPVENIRGELVSDSI